MKHATRAPSARQETGTLAPPAPLSPRASKASKGTPSAPSAPSAGTSSPAVDSPAAGLRHLRDAAAEVGVTLAPETWAEIRRDLRAKLAPASKASKGGAS